VKLATLRQDCGAVATAGVVTVTVGVVIVGVGVGIGVDVGLSVGIGVGAASTGAMGWGNMTGSSSTHPEKVTVSTLNIKTKPILQFIFFLPHPIFMNYTYIYITLSSYKQFLI